MEISRSHWIQQALIWGNCFAFLLPFSLIFLANFTFLSKIFYMKHILVRPYCVKERSLFSSVFLRSPFGWPTVPVSPNWAGDVPTGPGSYFLGRPLDKCLRFINSASSTIQKLPKSSSYRTKHLCNDRFVRIAFFISEVQRTGKEREKKAKLVRVRVI